MVWTLAALLFLLGGPAHAARKDLTVQEQYELGLRYLKRGYYVKALEQFNRIRNTHRDDPYSVKAELAIADVYFKKSEWDQARLAYEDFMRMHPRHADLDYVVYRMGMSLHRKAPKVAGRDQTWTKQAVHTWAGFAGRFPDSSYKDEVEELLDQSRDRLAEKELLIAQFYVRRRAWPAVSDRAEGMIRTYPDSVRVSDALYLDGVAASYLEQQDLLTWVRARLAEKDAARLTRLDSRVARIEKRNAAKRARKGEDAPLPVEGATLEASPPPAEPAPVVPAEPALAAPPEPAPAAPAGAAEPVPASAEPTPAAPAPAAPDEPSAPSPTVPEPTEPAPPQPAPPQPAPSEPAPTETPAPEPAPGG